MDPWEDAQELVTALAGHDERAWRYFLREHGRLIRGVLARFDFDAATRDDLFQETCLTILRSLNTLRDPRRLSSWIYSITHRLAIDARRKRKAEICLDDVAENRHWADNPDPEPPFAHQYETLELAARTIDGIRQLDPRCRALLSALYIQDPPRSYQQISQSHGIPLGSIGPTRARCLEKLRERVFPLSNPSSRTSTEMDA